WDGARVTQDPNLYAHVVIGCDGCGANGNERLLAFVGQHDGSDRTRVGALREAKGDQVHVAIEVRPQHVWPELPYVIAVFSEPIDGHLGSVVQVFVDRDDGVVVRTGVAFFEHHDAGLGWGAHAGRVRG